MILISICVFVPSPFQDASIDIVFVTLTTDTLTDIIKEFESRYKWTIIVSSSFSGLDADSCYAGSLPFLLVVGFQQNSCSAKGLKKTKWLSIIPALKLLNFIYRLLSAKYCSQGHILAEDFLLRKNSKYFSIA